MTDCEFENEEDEEEEEEAEGSVTQEQTDSINEVIQLFKSQQAFESYAIHLLEASHAAATVEKKRRYLALRIAKLRIY